MRCTEQRLHVFSTASRLAGFPIAPLDHLAGQFSGFQSMLSFRHMNCLRGLSNIFDGSLSFASWRLFDVHDNLFFEAFVLLEDSHFSETKNVGPTAKSNSGL